MTLSIGAKLRNFQTSQIGRSVQSTFELKPRLAGTEFLDAETGRQKSPVCTENLNPDVVVMKSTKNGVRFDGSGSLNRARNRRILVQ